MKKKLLALSLGFLFLNSNSQNQKFCGTDEVTKKWFNSHPEIKADYMKRQREAKTRDSIASMYGYSNRTAAASPVYTIPIVFHVLHQYGAENISDAQIIDEVNILNRDYRKLNADTINIFAPFSAADVRFHFQLATKDTSGNCTNGITRHLDNYTIWTIGDPLGYNHTWDPSKYLNIYVVKSFGPGNGVAAYSSFPGTNPPFMDVIVSLHEYVGSIGTSSPFTSRTLTHEIGHWFDLHHVWGDTQCGTVCGDDGVNDTPITKGWNNCPGSPQAICNAGITENHQNYMEYSFCENMFTNGQVARMTAAINSTVSGRNNLWTNSNLIATGVINPLSSCAPIVDLHSATYTVCSGGSLTFNDVSYNGTVTARSWLATGGAIISNSTAVNTQITFPAPGTQTVTLFVANATGSSTASKIVTVLNGTANIANNYPESFENAGLPLNFSIINIDNDVTWAQTSLAAATGSNCYFIDGSSDAPASNPDIMETPSYDFSSDPSATFTFKYAYAKKNAANADNFKVLASSDCGSTWVNVYQPSNSFMALNSGGTTNVPFFPAPAQFVTYTLTDNPNFGSFLSLSNVRIRFSFTEDGNAGYGNNIFLDDINFNSVNVAGINALTKSISFNLFPNPAKTIATIQITLSDNSSIKYFVTDVIGKIVEEEKSFNAEPGSHKFVINENQKLKSGIYFVNFAINGQRILRKLIIE
jgi:PKD repeat protein